MFDASTAGPVEAEAEAMRAISAGDARAFERLYLAHRDALFRVAWGILLDEEEARDVVQETFLQMHRAAPRWRADARVYTWLSRVAVNRSLSLRRRLRGLFRGTAPAAAASLESVLAHAQALSAVARALGGLPRRQRAVVALHLEQELRPAEIAPLVGLSANATRVALHRGLQRVRAELEARGIDAQPSPPPEAGFEGEP